jgi:molybdopterin molybdotransferase
VVTVGGVSVGDYDVVKPALEAAGAELGFWKVKIKPGKPLVWGRAGRARILGLPGNPASAMVTFTLFGAPLLRALQGDRRPVPMLRSLRLTTALRQKPGRRGFYRAALSPNGVTPLANQASGAPTTMAWADALIVVHEDSSGFEAGSEVPVLVLADA